MTPDAENKPADSLRLEILLAALPSAHRTEFERLRNVTKKLTGPMQVEFQAAFLDALQRHVTAVGTLEKMDKWLSARGLAEPSA